MAESKEELKSFLMNVKGKSEKAGLKLNIQKDKIMASSPITLWQIHGETMKSDRLYFLGPQNHCMILDGDVAMKLKDSCSLEETLLEP